jgi:hypothetical protein
MSRTSTKTDPAATTAVLSVPLFVRDLVLDAAEHEKIRHCGVTVGRRIEVDLDAVGQIDSELAERMASYWERCRAFWDSYRRGDAAGDGVLVRRVLTQAVQSDAPGGRGELGVEVDAVTALPVVGELIEELLGPDPDIESISRRGFRLGLSLRRDNKKNMLRIAVRMQARNQWPADLGGTHSSGELHRVIEMRISHAKWRDRKSRRLVEMTIWAEEIWPDPR